MKAFKNRLLRPIFKISDENRNTDTSVSKRFYWFWDLEKLAANILFSLLQKHLIWLYL